MSLLVQFVTEKTIMENIWANILSLHGSGLYLNVTGAMIKCFRGEDFSQELR
jgi:hypothetical protein